MLVKGGVEGDERVSLSIVGRQIVEIAQINKVDFFMIGACIAIGITRYNR